MAAANQSAHALKALVSRAHKPLVLANVYDVLSARAVGELPSSEALATASYAVARSADTSDDNLDAATNLAGVRPIAEVAKKLGKPLSVDIQDAYGDKLEETIGTLLDWGVAGVNLEDYDGAARKLYDISTAVDRIKRTLAVAQKKGVPDFVVNARVDAVVQGGTVEEAAERGKQYLAAGATTVFVWGAGRGLARAEVELLVKAFGGKLNVLLKNAPDGLSVAQLADIGVARISVGPRLQIAAFKALQAEAKKVLEES